MGEQGRQKATKDGVEMTERKKKNKDTAGGEQGKQVNNKNGD